MIAGRPVKHLHMTSKEAVSLLPNNVTAVYIDGAHDFENVVADIENYRLKLCPGGFLCGHDYGSFDYPDVKRAVDSAINEPDFIFEDKSWLWKNRQ